MGKGMETGLSLPSEREETRIDTAGDDGTNGCPSLGVSSLVGWVLALAEGGVCVEPLGIEGIVVRGRWMATGPPLLRRTRANAHGRGAQPTCTCRHGHAWHMQPVPTKRSGSDRSFETGENSNLPSIRSGSNPKASSDSEPVPSKPKQPESKTVRGP